MKKIVIRVVSFVLIFILLFQTAQQVFSKRWNSLYARNKDYISAPEGSIDVLCFGTSECFADYDPMVTYQAEGITGYNFAITYKSGLTQYYQLMQALKYHTPKVVLCDFSSMYEDQIPSGDEKIEAMYCRVLDCTIDPALRMAMIRDLCELDPSRSVFSWMFPLLRYHSLWTELAVENFLSRDEASADYMKESKGALLEASPYSGTVFDLVPEIWQSEPKEQPFSDISMKYYDMFIEECQNRGIQVVCVVPPKITDAGGHAAKCAQMKAYFDAKGVYYLDYNNYEQTVERMGLSLERDYYDGEHLNVPGSIKFSVALARDLKEIFQLEDHRSDPAYQELWTNEWLPFAVYCIERETTIANSIDTIQGLGLKPSVTIYSWGNPESNAVYQKLQAMYPGLEVSQEDPIEGKNVTVSALDFEGNPLCTVDLTE